jgi:DNA-nicking Smr family endonuclease
MRGARPIARGRERVVAPPPAPSSRKRSSGSAAASPFVVEQSGETIAGRAPDVSLKLLHALRGGQPASEARIDLHGRARAEALRELQRFVTSARAHAVRCLLVIHGRGRGSDAGGPVLRPAVWEWLAGPAAVRCGVMAFASARPVDGGDGATLVYLRRNAR